MLFLVNKGPKVVVLVQLLSLIKVKIKLFFSTANKYRKDLILVFNELWPFISATIIVVSISSLSFQYCQLHRHLLLRHSHYQVQTSYQSSKRHPTEVFSSICYGQKQEQKNYRLRINDIFILTDALKIEYDMIIARMILKIQITYKRV